MGARVEIRYGDVENPCSSWSTLSRLGTLHVCRTVYTEGTTACGVYHFSVESEKVTSRTADTDEARRSLPEDERSGRDKKVRLLR
jgi:hypothetical protein